MHIDSHIRSVCARAGSADTPARIGALLVRATVALGALVAIVASASLATYFAFTTGKHEHFLLGLIFAAAVLGGELLKPFAVGAAFDCLRRWQIGRGLVCGLVAAVCIIYSISGELALFAGSRGDSVAARVAASVAVADARSDRSRWLADLAALKPSRSVGELEPLVATARANRCRIDVSLRGGRNTVCSKDPALLAELGRARARLELETKLARAETKKPVTDADPLAANVGYYLGFLGYRIATPDLSRWLYLIPVALIEFTSAFGIVVYRAVSTGRDGPKPRPATVPSDHPPAKREPQPSRATVPSRGTVLPFRNNGAKARVLALIQSHAARHGTLPSQNFLVEQTSVPKSTISRWLREWEGAGVISRTRTGRCNVIRSAVAGSA